MGKAKRSRKIKSGNKRVKRVIKAFCSAMTTALLCHNIKTTLAAITQGTKWPELIPEGNGEYIRATLFVIDEYTLDIGKRNERIHAMMDALKGGRV